MDPTKITTFRLEPYYLGLLDQLAAVYVARGETMSNRTDAVRRAIRLLAERDLPTEKKSKKTSRTH